MRWARTLLACLPGVLAAPPALAQLCTADETVVFSCHIGHKTLSLCRPSGVRGQLAYRFGKPGQVELDYPDQAARRAPAPFELAMRPLYGGGVTTVRFQRGAWQYEVYSKAGRGDDPDRTPFAEDGVIVSHAGKPVWEQACADGGEGFREELGWLPRARGD
jgi:hypothetical protein